MKKILIIFLISLFGRTIPLLAEGEFLIDTDSTAPNSQHSPSVAFDGMHYLVVWKDDRGGGWDIYGARVDTSGRVLDTEGIAISTAAGHQIHPSVVFDSTNYIVVWEDNRNGNWDIYGSMIDTSGAIIDSFVVSTQAGDQSTPAITKGAGNQLLVTWAGWAPEPYNTMRIWGKLYPLTGVEEDYRFKITDLSKSIYSANSY